MVLAGGASSQSYGLVRWCWEVVLVHSLMTREVVLGGGASSQSYGQGRWCWQAVLVHSLMVRGGRAGRWWWFTV